MWKSPDFGSIIPIGKWNDFMILLDSSIAYRKDRRQIRIDISNANDSKIHSTARASKQSVCVFVWIRLRKLKEKKKRITDHLCVYLKLLHEHMLLSIRTENTVDGTYLRQLRKKEEHFSFSRFMLAYGE